MTVRETVSEWLAEKAMQVRPRTYEQYESVIRKYVNPVIGDRLSGEITGKVIYDVLVSVPYTRTRQIVYAVLRMIFPMAMPGVKNPRHDAEPPRWWSADQARRFLDASRAAGDDMYICWVLALYCGLRRGELVGLRWSDIDQQSGVIHVRNQRQRLKNGVVDCKPKSLSSIRDIPIASTPVIDALCDHYAVSMAENVIERRAGSPYVLSKNGIAINPGYVDYRLKRSIKAHGMQIITCHQMRHTCATICITAGVPLNVVSALLGHGGVSITAKVYAHVQREAIRNAICCISEILTH